MQKVNNYGSVLQAYSLKKILQNLGHEVSFIDIEANEQEDNLIKDYKSVLYNSEIERTLKFNKYIINKIILKLKERFFSYKFDVFREKYLEINGNENNNSYDLCIIGSDEVFNCLQKAPWGFTSQLLGNVRQAKRVITYAACCGSTSYDKLPENIKTLITFWLNKNDSISVRDNNTKEFVKNCIGIIPPVHLDPVAIGDFSEEIRNHYNILNKMPKHYCIVYLYQNRIKDENEINYIKKFCKEKKLTIIGVGEIQKWILKHAFVKPFEILALFSGADFVITDTFHGTLFGAKYAKKMAVFIRESNKNKLGDLILRLSLNSHVANDLIDIEKIFNIRINKDRLNELLEKEKYRSLDYLNQNIIKKENDEICM